MSLIEALFSKSLPFWHDLTDRQKALVLENALLKKYNKGARLHYGSGECTGLEILQSGQIRVFINSSHGGEITLYRLLAGDICILSAACMIKNLDFDKHMEFEKASEVYVIPRSVYQILSDHNPMVKDFTLELISSRFSDVMWLVNQLVVSNMGQRLACALMERSQLSGNNTVYATHETIARDLGSAREVVTRLLKQFQLDGMVSLSRGQIQILDVGRLRNV